MNSSILLFLERILINKKVREKNMKRERGGGNFFHSWISKYKEGDAFYRLPIELHLLTLNVSNESTLMHL